MRGSRRDGTDTGRAAVIADRNVIVNPGHDSRGPRSGGCPITRAGENNIAKTPTGVIAAVDRIIRRDQFSRNFTGITRLYKGYGRRGSIKKPSRGSHRRNKFDKIAGRTVDIKSRINRVRRQFGKRHKRYFLHTACRVKNIRNKPVNKGNSGHGIVSDGNRAEGIAKGSDRLSDSTVKNNRAGAFGERGGVQPIAGDRESIRAGRNRTGAESKGATHCGRSAKGRRAACVGKSPAQSDRVAE